MGGAESPGSHIEAPLTVQGASTRLPSEPSHEHAHGHTYTCSHTHVHVCTLQINQSIVKDRGILNQVREIMFSNTLLCSCYDFHRRLRSGTGLLPTPSTTALTLLGLPGGEPSSLPTG